MISPCLITLCIIWYSPFLTAQTSSLDEEFILTNSTKKSLHKEIQPQKREEKNSIVLESPNDGGTSDLVRLWRAGHLSHHHRHLRTTQGTVNIIGWGILLPIGVIIARYFKKVPLKGNDWYSLHVVSQLSGFLLGTVGWGLGLAIKNAAKETRMSTHGILGTIIFAFAALQPNEGHERRKYWVIYHRIIGYALIVVITANIFEGMNNQNPAALKKFRWFYGVTVGVLSFTALALEVNRWIN
ncbi:cytochrome b561 and DOMON domain-containing protein At5g35735-like [Olea europaea var. sylvestris]|uniref:cytochrome b561 and DOMON domain-containing protein At5g35735-like n=1 Tax=Olea europaea var. sylvestris TaxID=158386 RepID=UPI000C1D3C6E|nr:cytochrome b561 and DOMON domain-containing protein At5g35735-like [Olea europaea var. sylvestris]